MSRLGGRRRGADEEGPPAATTTERVDYDALVQRIRKLEGEVQECRQLNRRLADVVDVVSELLVPALDRDDARVAAALARLQPPPQ